MPERAPEPEYPQEEAVRRVRWSSEIQWRCGLVYVSSAPIGELVCVEETDEG